MFETSVTEKLEVEAIQHLPDIAVGDDLAGLLGDCLDLQGGLIDGDILCIAHKVFSKSEGNITLLESVSPSTEAITYAQELNKDPRKVEVVLRQSKRVLRAFKRAEQDQGTMICEHRLGFISANAGVDESNVGELNTVITLPDDPDASARALARALEARFGCSIGVVMTDTFGRPWRLGQVNIAIGLHRVPAKTSDIGGVDAWSRPLSVTEPALADELAAASGLVIRKAAKTPVVRFRGLKWDADEDSSALQLLRKVQEDMFR